MQPRNYGPVPVQIKKLEKKLAKIESAYETAPALRKTRLLKTGKRITERLDSLKKMLTLLSSK